MNDRQDLDRIPKQVPEGRIVVHNHIRPPTRRLNSRGFRAWLEPADTPRRVVCGCGWAPELGEHYRVRREGES